MFEWSRAAGLALPGRFPETRQSRRRERARVRRHYFSFKMVDSIAAEHSYFPRDISNSITGSGSPLFFGSPTFYCSTEAFFRLDIAFALASPLI